MAKKKNKQTEQKESSEFYGVYVYESDGDIRVVYDIYDSEFDDNDFSYTFSISSIYAQKLKKLLKASTKEELNEKIKSGFGENYYESGLESFLKKKGIHGTKTVREDYPGGICGTERF